MGESHETIVSQVAARLRVGDSLRTPRPGVPGAISGVIKDPAGALVPGDKDVPVDQRRFREGYYLRPNLVQSCHSKNILIEGVTMKNAPMFEVNPVLCTNVTVRGIKIVSHGPNNDGCDPDSSTDVLIENCSFDTGDDCIAIKAGRNRDAIGAGGMGAQSAQRRLRLFSTGDDILNTG